MTEYKRIAIDTLKAASTLHGTNQQGQPVLRINLRRPQLLAVKQMPDWLRGPLARKWRNVVAVALANKMAWMAWGLMTRGEVYRRPAAAAA